VLSMISLPTVVVRVGAEVAIAVVALVWVRPVDRTVAVGVGGAATVTAIAELLVPVTELAGLVAMGMSGTGPDRFDSILYLFLPDVLAPLGHAVLLGVIAWGLARLSGRLVPEARAGWGR
jgi:hypothetical protein